jgi:hypothetical protein
VAVQGFQTARSGGGFPLLRLDLSSSADPARNADLNWSLGFDVFSSTIIGKFLDLFLVLMSAGKNFSK